MPDLPTYAFKGQVLDAHLHILDRQVLDNDEVPVGHVDDIELEDPESAHDLNPESPPAVTNLILNSGFWQRVFGGRPPLSEQHRVPWSAVREIGTAIELGEPESSFNVTWSEHWVRRGHCSPAPGSAG